MSTNVENTMSNDEKNRLLKKPTTRPAMQIYRPPGLRSGGVSNGDSQRENDNFPEEIGRESVREPAGTAGSKPPSQRSTPSPGRSDDGRREENNNKKGGAGVSAIQQRLNRTESSLSSESALSQKSGASGNQPMELIDRRRKGPTPPKNNTKEKPKKVMSPKELDTAVTSLRRLQISNYAAELEQLIASDFACDSSAECVGTALAQHAIETGTGSIKNVTKACGLLRDSPSFGALSKGLLNSISQYFDCRDRLRQEHFRMWISFLSFVSDLYSNIGCTPTGELVNVVFQVFEYLLRAPILENLKIEELESLISALLSIGYDLERDCPDQLSALKDLIRDAFIDVTEPWARKMILLLLELGASGWKLPPEANEYYFQQGNN